MTKAMDLAQQIFQLTDRLPQKEAYELISKMRGSAWSVSGNLAEEFGRHRMKGTITF